MDDLRYIEELRARIRNISKAHQAGALAVDLLEVPEPERRLTGVQDEFVRWIHAKGLQDIAEHQASYAVRLAGWSGDLIYEEMHKLLSLATETYALEQLGFSLPAGRRQELEMALRNRFARQPAVARMAAQDKVKDWNRGLWWFAELIAD